MINQPMIEPLIKPMMKPFIKSMIMLILREHHWAERHERDGYVIHYYFRHTIALLAAMQAYILLVGLLLYLPCLSGHAYAFYPNTRLIIYYSYDQRFNLYSLKDLCDW
jgi:hypothetical protein